MSRTARATLVVSVAAVGATGAVLAVLLVARRGGAVALDQASFAAADLVYISVALIISLARPRHPVGTLALAGTCVTGMSEALVAWGERGLIDLPGSVPGAAVVLAIGLAGRSAAWVVLVAALPLVFPDGHLVGSGPRRRAAAGAAAVGATALGLGALLAPNVVDNRLAGRPNPLGLPTGVTTVAGFLSVVGMVSAAVATALAIAGLVTRWRRGEGLLRQQLLWFSAAFAVPLLLTPVFVFMDVTAWAFGVALLPVPVALGVAMLQHQLYDVQLALSRSATWLALSGLVAALYAVTVGGVGAMFRGGGDTWVPWFAAGVVAVSFAPLRNALQAGVNRLVYGRWSEAGAVLAATGRRLSDAADVPALLQELATDLGTALGLGHVEIRDAQGRAVSVHGAPGPADESMPLTAYGEVVGVLRWGGRRLRESDRVLLEDVARQVGGVVHASHLVHELRSAQERLVLAGEDERRRLRRDLHDGLGPALAGLTLQVDTARNLLDRDVAQVDQQLLTLRAGIRSTVQDVRRIVEGLRPPALDELGLAGGVAELGRRLAAESGCVIEVCAPTCLPELAAAVEVAAFRIAQEALTNVVRHSGAASCRVDLAVVGGELLLRVQDDGNGLARPRPGGVGLAGMHERAAEIGGRLDLVARPGRGTSVGLRLPIADRPDGRPTS